MLLYEQLSGLAITLCAVFLFGSIRRSIVEASHVYVVKVKVTKSQL